MTINRRCVEPQRYAKRADPIGYAATAATYAASVVVVVIVVVVVANTDQPPTNHYAEQLHLALQYFRRI